ncbi:MAG: carbon starvation protein A [Lentisphaeria bacterium]|nr:carbon starvation protein A [Lentisphaeria bacterium]MDY0176442.1 carbon starvation protein A [Lentisphaeria bacterium]
MNAAWLMLISALYFAAAYVFYGNFLKKVFGVEPQRACPSHELADGVDYVASPPPVLFGHHFASIAGAGPIVGPVLASQFGWLPALLWVCIGCVFVGAMHDFAAMFLSIRNQGRSIAYVVEKELGYVGRQLFLLFCFAMLVLVVTVFAILVADSFLAVPAVASSSLLFIIIAPMFGVAVGRKILSLAEATLIFVPMLFLCVWVGTLLPLDLSRFCSSAGTARMLWLLILFYYCYCASVLPVWVLLQPRDYLNSFLLYVMIAAGLAGVFVARPSMALPPIVAESPLIPSVFPLLFVTVACGACSGFHAMIASGTSAKQIDKESHILPISYGGMLIEGLLAVLVICSISHFGLDNMKAMFAAKEAPQLIFANGLGQLCESMHIPFAVARNFVALAISAFIMTSLDTATRLGRFIWQEMLLPGQSQEGKAGRQKNIGPLRSLLGNRWFATLGIIAFSAVMAFSGSGQQLWPVFGASNQLLAALTLLAISLYLNRTKRPLLFALLPFIFMLLISIWALLVLIGQQWGKSMALVTVSSILLILALVLCALGLNKFIKHMGKQPVE